MSRILGRTLVRAWRLVRSAGLDLFRPGAADALGRLAGWSALRLPMEDLGATSSVTPLEALRALELVVRERPAEQTTVRLVATLPGQLRGLPMIRDAVRSLVRGAQRELLVVGYAIRDREFRELLFEKGLGGVRVTVVGDRKSADLTHLCSDWPARATALIALEDVEPAKGDRGRMHGKLLVADRRQALVGSANFTVGGLRNNYEWALLVEGEPAEAIWSSVESLAREGWLTSAKRR